MPMKKTYECAMLAYVISIMSISIQLKVQLRASSVMCVQDNHLCCLV